MAIDSGKLRAAGRPELARILEAWGDTPVREHSARLHAHRPETPLEPALRDAFRGELRRCRSDPAVVEACLADLEERRVLQTATHLTASEGPTFLAVHRVATAGLPADRPYLVAAYSGVPFANPAWSGCLNYSDRHPLEALVPESAPRYKELERNQRQRALDSDDRRISLIPGRLRDARVYRTAMPDRTRDILGQLGSALREVLLPAGQESFGRWALQACERVTGRVLGLQAPVVFLDLNEVITAYLIRVLPDVQHPMHRLLFQPDLRNRVMVQPGLGGPWFSAARQEPRRERLISLAVHDDRLVGDGMSLPLSPEPMVQGLVTGLLCPGLLPTFAALSFLNGFSCLGSFEQVGYLARFREGLNAVHWPEPGVAARGRTDALTTGRCIGDDGRPVFPLDRVLGTPVAPLRPGCTLAEMISPLLPRLLAK